MAGARRCGLAFAEDGLVCLQILAINDLHGHIEQTEYLDGRPVGGVAHSQHMLERRPMLSTLSGCMQAI